MLGSHYLRRSNAALNMPNNNLIFDPHFRHTATSPHNDLIADVMYRAILAEYGAPLSNPASSPASTRYAYVVFLKIERSLFLSKSLLFLLSPYCCHYQIYNPLINNQHLLFGYECFQYDPCVCLSKVMSSMILSTCL